MRNIFEVLEQIKNLSNDKEYIKKVEKIDYSLRWKAPEYMWNYMFDAFITDYIPPKTDLDYQILSIWTTKSVEELKKQTIKEDWPMKEKTSDEMFEELGFEKSKLYKNIILYENEKMEIEFWTDMECVKCDGRMNVNIVQAINKKCQELGWLDE